MSIEKLASDTLEGHPKIREFAKKAYQFMWCAISAKSNTYGKLIRLTPDDGYEYFFGYYDKSPWDASGRYLIALKAECTRKNPAPKEPAVICLIDTKDRNRLHKIAITRAWNSQQGCMAQWLGPNFDGRLIYNDFRNGAYCSVIYDAQKNSEEKLLPMPIYDVSKDGVVALSLDFSRLHRIRPGYGYSNLPDHTKDELCPDKTCIWRMELLTGEVTPLIKYTDLLSFEHDSSMDGADHKVNHIMINPSCTRFMLIHRWIKKGRKHSRLITADCDGKNLFNLSDDIFVSHCYWKNDEEILSFLNKNKLGRHYYLMKDKTQKYKMMWSQLDMDGHCSYSPNGTRIITDTYPDRRRIAHVLLCDTDGVECKRIAGAFSPFKYSGDCRCDLHPRWSRDGKRVCIDSVHEGIKGMYEIMLPD